MSQAEDVITFWLSEVGPKGWYMGGDELDQTVRDRYLDLWNEALHGGLHSWLTSAREVLAYLILTDQFPRNMFREDPRAFATDPQARSAAKAAINLDMDRKISEPERQFFYLPLMHSECITDQDRCVRLMLTRMTENGESNLLHAKAHRELIRRFGRFPFRNSALARCSTSEEKAFLEEGGYGQIVKELQG